MHVYTEVSLTEFSEQVYIYFLVNPDSILG